MRTHNYYVITVAFCPAGQLARCLMEYQKNHLLEPTKHVVVMGHYPVNTKKNNRDIQYIVESYGKAELWDPGKNLGSAQSQNWALSRLNPPDDSYFSNWDPDSNCKMLGWDLAMRDVLNADPNCVLISCRAPLIEKLIDRRHQKFNVRTIESQVGIRTEINYGILEVPTPFNLSMIRHDFVKQIGGFPQLGEYWGESEAPFYVAARQRGKYHAYLMDYFEEESGKFMQDRQLLNFKDLNMRTAPPDNFLGNYTEFLRYKHRELLTTDTYIDESTEFQ